MTTIATVLMAVMSQVPLFGVSSVIIILLTRNTGTSACIKGIFYCVNKGYKGVTLFSSQVNDGICGKFLYLMRYMTNDV